MIAQLRDIVNNDSGTDNSNSSSDYFAEESIKCVVCFLKNLFDICNKFI